MSEARARPQLADGATLAALEEERDFLLASLEDLEREHQAGDVDEHDYLALRDDYTARAAAVARAIDRRRLPPVAAHRPWRRSLAWVVVVLAFGTLAGVLIAQASGTRRASDVATGDIRASSRQLLADAQIAAASGDVGAAIEMYGEVLAIQPSNVEALTYRAWLTARSGDLAGAWPDLDDAVELDPGYPDARVFRAILLLEEGRHAEAAGELDAFDSLGAPAVMRRLVESRRLRERILTAQVTEALLVADPPTPAEAGIPLADVRTAAETLAEMARLQDALVLFNLVLAEDPGDVRARTYKGWALARAGVETGHLDAVELGLGELDRALESDPRYPDALVFRAFTLLYGLDRPADARRDLAAFDALVERPPMLVELIEQHGLREQLTAALDR